MPSPDATNRPACGSPALIAVSTAVTARAKRWCFRRAANRRDTIRQSLPAGRTARYLELTGWAAGKGARPWGSGRPGDASLPYSDHADFNDLVAYVRAAQPQRVYTALGFPDLAAHLRQQGYAATHLGKNATPADLAFQMPLL